jgi:hypothetical protein
MHENRRIKRQEWRKSSNLAKAAPCSVNYPRPLGRRSANDTCAWKGVHGRRNPQEITRFVRESALMKHSPKRDIRRRDLLHVTIAAAGATAASTLLPGHATAKPVDMKDKRRARYQANSTEVRNFYRVNSYPTR